MTLIVKLGFLVFLALAANAAPVQDDVVTAAVDDIDGLNGRESRSSESMGEPGIPWHLDRIDQRKAKLNGKYNTFANGNSSYNIIILVMLIATYMHAYMYLYTICTNACMHT